MNIYVGNLSYDTDDQALGDHFAQYGDVQSARVVTDRETGRPRGFGFVEMSTAEAGNAAINGLNGQDFMGRQLNINEAKPRENSGGGGRRDRY
ncbi:MAG: RNA recognition motif domain-containing protein [Candidatus Sericytochromatia bacterium]